MLTLSEFKADLGIDETDTSKDLQLRNFINRAKSMLDDETNRVLIADDFEEVIEVSVPHFAFLNNYPINEVADIKKLANDGVTYETIFISPDSAGNSVIYNDYGKIQLRNSYNFGIYYPHCYPYAPNVNMNENTASMKYKVLYNGGYIFQTLTGTARTTKGSDIVTGTDTLFTVELAENNYIIIGNEKRKVLEIISDTSLTVTEAFEDQHLGSVITLTNVPEALRNACLYLATNLYSKSAIGDGRFGLSSNNTGGQSNTGQTFNNPLNDIRSTIEDYRKINI